MRAAEQQPALSTDYMQIMVWNETLSAQPALGDDVPVCADLVRYKYAWGTVVLLCVCVRTRVRNQLIFMHWVSSENGKQAAGWHASSTHARAHPDCKIIMGLPNKYTHAHNICTNTMSG